MISILDVKRFYMDLIREINCNERKAWLQCRDFVERDAEQL